MERIWGKNYLQEIDDLELYKPEQIIIVPRSELEEAWKLLNLFESGRQIIENIDLTKEMVGFIKGLAKINRDHFYEKPPLHKFPSPELKNLKNPK